MHTRIIQTRFHKDYVVQQLSLEAHHLFICLLTCEHINISGIFELPDAYMCLEFKLTQKQLDKAKSELQKYNRAYFYEGWICVINAEKNNNYRNSPKNEIAYQKEIKRVPEKILQKFTFKHGTTIDSTTDTTINTTMHSSYKSEIINKNTKIHEIQENLQEKKIKIKEKKFDEIILKTWNEVFGTKYKATNGFSGNLQFWLQSYELDEILKAIKYAKKHSFWGDKITPMIFFRQRNPKGEGVDYIGEMLNTVQEKHKDDAELDPLVLTSLKIYEQNHGR